MQTPLHMQVLYQNKASSSLTCWPNTSCSMMILQFYKTTYFENIEIILVDDGSMDNSGKICDMYSETDARIISIHQENRGVSAARNKGIEQCRGEFVTFVDSDDCIAETYCEYLYKLCKENGTDSALTLPANCLFESAF